MSFELFAAGDTLMTEVHARTALEPPSNVAKSLQRPSQTEEGFTTWNGVRFRADRYLLGSYRIATAPELNSRRLTSFKSIYFDSPANNVGPWPASLGCTTNS